MNLMEFLGCEPREWGRVSEGPAFLNAELPNGWYACPKSMDGPKSIWSTAVAFFAIRGAITSSQLNGALNMRINRFWISFWPFLTAGIVLIILSIVLSWIIYPPGANRDKEISNLITEMRKDTKSDVSQDAMRVSVSNILESNQRRNFALDFASRFAEAALLAGFMIIFAESITRFLAKEHEQKTIHAISHNVWEAMFEKLVPPAIATEIKTILKSDVCRLRPTYRIFIGEHDGLGSDEIVVKRELSYKLLNLTSAGLDFLLQIGVMSHINQKVVLKGKEHSWPSIERVEVQGSEVPVPPGCLDLKRAVKLPVMNSEADAVEIFSAVQEIYSHNDRALYVLTAPCVGIEVEVINEIPRRVRLKNEHVFLTSGRQKLQTSSLKDRWVYDGGLLSGTSLSIAWEPIPAEEGSA